MQGFLIEPQDAHATVPQSHVTESMMLFDRAMAEYEDGAGAMLSTWRESVLTRMDRLIAEREGRHAAAVGE
mgnify:CR=1 FL=1